MEHKDIVQLVLGFLHESGYQGSLQLLQDESRVPFDIEAYNNPGSGDGRGKATHTDNNSNHDDVSYAGAGALIDLLSRMKLIDLHTKLEKIKQSESKPAGELTGFSAADFPPPDRLVNNLFQRGIHLIISSSNSHLPNSNILALDAVPSRRWIISGGADGRVNIGQISSGDELNDVSTINPHRGGVLAVQMNPAADHLILTGGMDKSHCLIDVLCPTSPQVKRFNHHSKYVVRAKWSSCGRFFATGSYDRTVCIYACRSESEVCSEAFRLVLKKEFKGSVESLWFVSNAYSGDNQVLVVSCRDDNHLYFIDVTHATRPGCALSGGEEEEGAFGWVLNLDVRRMMNVNELGDDHVSFTVLDLSTSPIHGEKERFLLASTDKNRMILFDIAHVLQSFCGSKDEARHKNGTSQEEYVVLPGKIVRNYYGLNSDEFSTPRQAWHPSGEYVYASSQDGCVYSWEVKTQQRCAGALKGHQAVVRDLVFVDMKSERDGKETPMIVTCGFDKTVKVWSL